MDNDILFEKYWKEVLFVDMQIVPTQKDKQCVLKSIGFARYRLSIRADELNRSIVNSLPNWLRKWIC